MFDLGGVLVENNMFDELPNLIEGPRVEDDLKSKWLRSPTVRKFELGLCSPKAFASEMVEEFGLSTSPSDFLEVFSGWPKGLYHEAPDLLTGLRASGKIGCLSNSNEIHWTDDVTTHFDHAYSSHLLQKIKPDREVFQFVTKDVGCEPNSIVFFDDSQLNVDAARAFGWQAHLTVGFAELSQTLKEIGVTA